MINEIYKNIEKISSEIIKLPENKDLFSDNVLPAGNFIISLGLSSLYEDTREVTGKLCNGWVNAATFLSICRKDIIADYPFPFDIKIPHDIPKQIYNLVKEYGFLFLAVAYEYFMESCWQESSSCRKSSGTYFTPSWVVKDILRKTLGKKLDELICSLKNACQRCDTFAFIQAWDRVEGIKILDPSCGWGIFLIEAYRMLETLYGDIFNLAGYIAKRGAREYFDTADMFCEDYIDLVEDTNLILEIMEECRYPGQRILKEHIFGVDINPDSAKIASHILRASASKSIEEEKRSKIEANIETHDFIGWVTDRNESFSIIIGNPPYFTIGGGGKGRSKTDYHDILKSHPLFSQYFRNQSDIFYYFIIGSIEILKPGGLLSFIVPSYMLDNEHACELRQEMLKKCRIEEIIDFAPLPVFETASGKPVGVDTLIFKATKIPDTSLISKKDPKIRVIKPYFKDKKPEAEQFLSEARKNPAAHCCILSDQSTLGSGKWVFSEHSSFLSLLAKDGQEIFPLGDISGADFTGFPAEFLSDAARCGICDIGQGQETGLSDIFVVSKEDADKLKLEVEILKPNIKGRHIKRWRVEESDEFIIMLTDDHDIDNYPNIKKYLEKHRNILNKRQRVISGTRKWYEISIPQNYELFNNTPKILVPYRASENRFAIDNKGYFNDGGDVRGIIIKPEWREKISYRYLLALLNSELITFWYSQAGKKKGNVYEFFTKPMSRIPVRIPPIEFQTKIENIVDKLMNNKVSNATDSIGAEEELNRLIFSIYKIDRSALMQK